MLKNTNSLTLFNNALCLYPKIIHATIRGPQFTGRRIGSGQVYYNNKAQQNIESVVSNIEQINSVYNNNLITQHDIGFNYIKNVSFLKQFNLTDNSIFRLMSDASKMQGTYTSTDIICNNSNLNNNFQITH